MVSIKSLRGLDALLNDMTMYRLMAYGLSVIAALALLFSFTGTLTLSGLGMLKSLAAILVGGYVTNVLLSHLFKAPRNVESGLITELILFCILPPATSNTRLAEVFLAGVLAMIAKYLIAWKRKHIFNPAASGAVVVALLGLVQASWWIGSTVMLPFTVLLGLLVVRKNHCFQMLGCFLLASFAAIIVLALNREQPIGTSLAQAITSSPLIFLGSIMLTEPATMPSRTKQRMVYGLLVGALAASQFHLGPVTVSAEFSLCLGNLFAYAVSPKYVLRLKLKEKRRLSQNIYEFVFMPDRQLKFTAGQYLAWTLPHMHPDSRGNRRSFTIASSPTEDTVQLGVKFYEPSSTFKRALKAMKPGDIISASQLSGNFVLPRKPGQKLVFIAGGIGITPFRSMVKYVVDSGQKCDIVLFYLVANQSELSYEDVWQQAKQHGVRTLAFSERLTAAAIEREVPDYLQRIFYISGPPSMVDAYTANLQKIGIKRRHIITDSFTGY